MIANYRLIKFITWLEAKRIRFGILREPQIDARLKRMGYQRAAANRFSNGKFIVIVMSSDWRRTHFRVLPIFHLTTEQLFAIWAGNIRTD